MTKKIMICIATVLLLPLCKSFGQGVPPAQDAAVIYFKAADLIETNYKKNIMAPAASKMELAEYPPFPDEWMAMEKTDFTANAPARELAHQARAMSRANWPLLHSPEGAKYLNRCRSLANELADAAMFQHFQDDDAAATETLLDLLHFADVLENETRDRSLIRMLVSIGNDALAANRAEMIAANLGLTKDPKDAHRLQYSSVAELIGQFQNFKDADVEVAAVARAEGAQVNSITEPVLRGLTKTIKRRNAECSLAAMTLACHLYRFDTGNWPKSLGDLRPYLPAMPVDPFGNGKQLLGYVVIQAGLPDGSDRPLVYSRCNSEHGLFYRTDQPIFYGLGEASNQPAVRQKQGGQFRDVAYWTPNPGDVSSPTTQPLPQ